MFFFLSQPMPEAATDIEFLDATVGMNIPKNFIPAIEKVLISRHFFPQTRHLNNTGYKRRFLLCQVC